MLITDKQLLEQYGEKYRIWQGIPGVAVTEKGRMFFSFYSGGTNEEVGNYALIVRSDDGEHFEDPVLVSYVEEKRCFDPVLWIDPCGRLWFTWSVMPRGGLYGTICSNPDAEELTWSEEFFIGHDVMMNKPIALSSGDWLFPVAVWDRERMKINIQPPYYESTESQTGSFVYRTSDQGKSFEKLGAADVENRQFDEHMVLERKDGSLAMYVRTWYGIGVSCSYDNGMTWSEGKDTGLGGPGSRFHICRLHSGRVLLINHCCSPEEAEKKSKERKNLAAFLSEDDGETWKYRLMLDERSSVSYPDAMEAKDGFLYITYDRERGCALHSFEEVKKQAREILYAKITEEDILAGRLVNRESKLKCIVSKLGEYEGDIRFPEEPAQ